MKEAELHSLPIQEAEEPKMVLGMHPLKFIMWLIIVSIVMVFASMTSAYLVRRADGNWLQFELPPQLWISSAVIIISSFTMHWAYWAASKSKIQATQIAMLTTTVLGLVFCWSQVQAWQFLVDINVYFVGNPSGSFVYVLTGLHVFHLVSGMLFLLVVLWQTLRGRVHANSLVSMEMCTTYWHFLDGLWLYLFFFLLANR